MSRESEQKALFLQISSAYLRKEGTSDHDMTPRAVKVMESQSGFQTQCSPSFWNKFVRSQNKT